MNTAPDKEDYAKHLREDSVHLSRTRIYSKNSPVIWLENFSIRAKEYLRNLHLDVNIARLALIAILAFSIIPAWRESEEDDSQKWVDMATILGAGITVLFAMTNMHDQYHQRKLEVASKYCERWNSEDFQKTISRVRDIFEESFYEKYPIEFREDNFNKCHSELIDLKRSPDGVEVLKSVQSQGYCILNRDLRVLSPNPARR